MQFRPWKVEMQLFHHDPTHTHSRQRSYAILDNGVKIQFIAYITVTRSA